MLVNETEWPPTVAGRRPYGKCRIDPVIEKIRMQHNLEEINKEFEGKVNLKELAGRVCVTLLVCGLAALSLTGCAGLTALALTPDPAGSAPEAPRTITTVKLSQANYHVQRLNVTGQDHGFKLLGLFTIVPASRVKAFTRMYHSAKIEPGGPLTPANIAVEQIEQSYILFSIPEVHVRADFVVFENTPPSEPHRVRNGSGSYDQEPDCDEPAQR